MCDEFADFVVSTLEILVAEQRLGLGEDGFDFLAERVRDDVIHDVARRVVDAFLFAQFVGVLDDDAPALLRQFVGEEFFIHRAHHVGRHEAEVVAVKVAEGEEFALAGFKAAGGGDLGRKRLVADEDGKDVVVQRERVAKQRLLEQLGVELEFDFLKKRFAEGFGKGFFREIAVKNLVMRIGARELVPFNQLVRLQHAREEETIEQLLAGDA